MNDKKKEKQKNNLVAAGLMDPEDNLVEFLQASYVEKLLGGKMGKWKPGWIYFTETRIVYPTGILNENIVIPYKSIRKLEKCSQGLFPMGIAVTHEDSSTGELVLDKFSMTKRDKWLDFLAEKAGISLS